MKESTPKKAAQGGPVNGDRFAVGPEAPPAKAVAVEIEFFCEACGCTIDEPEGAIVLQTRVTVGNVVEVVHRRCVPEYIGKELPRPGDGPVHERYVRMIVGTLMEVLPGIVAGEYRLSTRMAPLKVLKNNVRVVGVRNR